MLGLPQSAGCEPPSSAIIRTCVRITSRPNGSCIFIKNGRLVPLVCHKHSSRLRDSGTADQGRSDVLISCREAELSLKIGPESIQILIGIDAQPHVRQSHPQVLVRSSRIRMVFRMCQLGLI